MMSSVATRRGKYNNSRTSYGDAVYDSAAEAAYAAHLDFLKAAGQIREWGRGDDIILVGGTRKEKISYRPDFWVYESPVVGTFYVDVKGVQTAVWRLKMKLFRHVYPDARLKVVKTNGDERWL